MNKVIITDVAFHTFRESTKKFLLHPFLLLIIALPLALALTACGNKEPEQRAAFIQFLQSRIIDKPGVHVPKLTEEEAKSFGDYVTDYAVISHFNKNLDDSMKSLPNIMHKTAARSLNDLIAHYNDIKMARILLKKMDDTLRNEFNTANAAYAKLQQPDDLKAVFDKVYYKDVSLPVKTLCEDMLPALDVGFQKNLDLLDYVDAHKAQIDLSGQMAQVEDPVVLEDINKLFVALNVEAQNIKTIQARLQSVITGR